MLKELIINAQQNDDCAMMNFNKQLQSVIQKIYMETIL